MQEQTLQPGQAAGANAAEIRGRGSRSFYFRSVFLLVLAGCVIVGVGAFIARDLHNARLAAEQTYTESVVGLRMIGDLQYESQETRRSTLYALTTQDPNLQIQYADQSREADSVVAKIIRQHLERARTSDELQVGKLLEQDWRAYLKVRDEVLGLILEGGAEQAVQLDLKEGVPAFNRVRADLLEIKRLYDDLASDRVAAVTRSSRRSIVRLVVVLALTLVFAGVSVWAVERNRMWHTVQRTESRLGESEERYRQLVEMSPEAIFVECQGRFVFSNSANARLLGASSASDLIGKPLAEFVHPGYREIIERTMVQVTEQQNAVLRSQGKFVRLNGQEVDVEIVASQLQVQEEVGVQMIMRDITERKRLEEQLRSAQKMEAVGRLAGGIAHDFNNLLMVIRGYCEMILDRVPPGGSLRGNAEQIERAADRAASLTRQLLAFGRKQVLAPQVIDLNHVVENVGKMLWRVIGEHIELVTVLNRGLWSVKADPGQIEQVIVNLALNARDAMPQGGKLIIETRNADLDEDFVRQHPGAASGRFALLAVTDTGVGMDADTQTRIFEPFFTTKGQGKGTGLGLATAYGIVKQSGGSIWVYSEPGRGTTFNIYLPWTPERAQGAQPAADAGKLPCGSETVLLVEDSGALRKLAREFLEQGGYTVLEAGEGAGAMDVAQQHAGPIHLLLTDVVMPGMSGQQLATQLKRDRRETKVLYMSGYPEDAISYHGVLEPGVVLLQKPFTRKALADKVREVLGE